MNPIEIQVKLCHPNAKVPTKAHDSDLGWDIYVIADDSQYYTTLYKGKPIYINFWTMDAHGKMQCQLGPKTGYTFETGIALATPDNFGFLLRDRSSYGIKDICVHAGVIEGTYRSPWKIRLFNNGDRAITITEGDRICQAILTEILPGFTTVVDELPISERGTKGFGSSGK